jgi:hypothetical protein
VALKESRVIGFRDAQHNALRIEGEISVFETAGQKNSPKFGTHCVVEGRIYDLTP